MEWPGSKPSINGINSINAYLYCIGSILTRLTTFWGTNESRHHQCGNFYGSRTIKLRILPASHWIIRGNKEHSTVLQKVLLQYLRTQHLMRHAKHTNLIMDVFEQITNAVSIQERPAIELRSDGGSRWIKKTRGRSTI